MITEQEAVEFLAAYGASPHSVAITAITEAVLAREDCLREKGLPDSVIKLALLYSFAIFGLNQGSSKIKSQSAPSGASRSFEHQSDAKRIDGLINNLKSLGAYDCFEDLLPETAREVHAGLIVVRGR